jgi:hypothetical protein
VCLSTSVGHSNSVSRGKNSLLLVDLLQRIDDTMFDNPFDDQHRFDYFEPSDNEDDETLDPNVIVNDNDDVDNDIDDDVMMKSYLLILNLGMLLSLVLLFLMIVYKVINIFQKGLS